MDKLEFFDERASHWGEHDEPRLGDVIREGLRAFEIMPDEQIVDLGCGTGGQTIVLAQNTPWNITAIDLFPGFIKGV